MFKFRLKDGLNPEEYPLPKRGSNHSAGYDIYLTDDIELGPNCYINQDSYIHIDDMPKDTVGLLFPRSSMGIHYQVRLLNSVGVIDADYKGTISIGIHNFGGKHLKFKKGERIGQLVFVKYNIIDDDGTDETRDGGIGSTGR